MNNLGSLLLYLSQLALVCVFAFRVFSVADLVVLKDPSHFTSHMILNVRVMFGSDGPGEHLGQVQRAQVNFFNLTLPLLSNCHCEGSRRNRQRVLVERLDDAAIEGNCPVMAVTQRKVVERDILLQLQLLELITVWVRHNCSVPVKAL